MSRVEKLISLVYAAKDRRPHQQIWWAVSALELYKEQATWLRDLALKGLMVEKREADFDRMRSKLSESLINLCEVVDPIISRSA